MCQLEPAKVRDRVFTSGHTNVEQTNIMSSKCRLLLYFISSQVNERDRHLKFVPHIWEL